MRCRDVAHACAPPQAGAAKTRTTSARKARPFSQRHVPARMPREKEVREPCFPRSSPTGWRTIARTLAWPILHASGTNWYLRRCERVVGDAERPLGPDALQLPVLRRCDELAERLAPDSAVVYAATSTPAGTSSRKPSKVFTSPMRCACALILRKAFARVDELLDQIEFVIRSGREPALVRDASRRQPHSPLAPVQESRCLLSPRSKRL